MLEHSKRPKRWNYRNKQHAHTGSDGCLEAIKVADLDSEDGRAPLLWGQVEQVDDGIYRFWIPFPASNTVIA